MAKWELICYEDMTIYKDTGKINSKEFSTHLSSQNLILFQSFCSLQPDSLWEQESIPSEIYFHHAKEDWYLHMKVRNNNTVIYRSKILTLMIQP